MRGEHSMRTIHIDPYYTSMEHLLGVYDQEHRKLGFSAGNEREYREWKRNTREKLAEITGFGKMQTCDLQTRLLESIRLDDYRRDRLLIQTEPEVWMPFYVLVPDGMRAGEKRPCMIAPHGHGSAGKFSPAGRMDIPSVREAIERYHYDYGVQFVRKGYITFCPDARGFGERREWTKQTDSEADFLTSTCMQLNHMAICLGLSLTGMWTWDLTRLIDYIETRGDCIAEQIGCGGLSGGGLQTLWLSAMDDRIKCAVVSGYFYGYRDSLLKLSGNCGCNYVPHLWENVDMGDLGALIAPRALLIETGSADPLNGERGLENVLEQLAITREAYALFEAENRLVHHIFDGSHMWNGKKTFAFLERHIRSAPGNGE